MSSKKLTIPNSYLRELGYRIKELINDRGINQKILARAVNLSEPSISAIVKGEQEPGASKILGISNYFGINPGWLLTGNGAKILIEKESEHQDRKTYRRNEDKGLIEFRDKFIHWFVDVSNIHSHIWIEVNRLRNDGDE